MARFDTIGLDELLEDMKRLGELSGDVADKMLMAGADVVKDEWRKSAEKNQLRDTGDMIESIGFPRQPKTIGGIRTIDIYPQGKDRKGVRNAEKAFILNYGTQGTSSENAKRKRENSDKRKGPGIPATHWVDDADKASGEPVMEAMGKIWDEHLKGLK